MLRRHLQDPVSVPRCMMQKPGSADGHRMPALRRLPCREFPAGTVPPARESRGRHGSMSISSLRWRAPSALIAAGAAAAAVLALTVPAGAVTGTAEISPEEAGYTATGAQFSNVFAAVFLRQPTQYAGEVGQYSQSVQLWSSGLVAVVGASASTSGSSYTPYVKIYDASSHQLLASDPNAFWCNDLGGCKPTIGTFAAGGTATFSVTYNRQDGDLFFAAVDHTYPGWGLGGEYTASTGVSFSQARIGTEFGSTPWDNSYSHTPPAQLMKTALFNDVSLTPYRGRI